MDINSERNRLGDLGNRRLSVHEIEAARLDAVWYADAAERYGLDPLPWKEWAIELQAEINKREAK